jgi:hypothetical protein
MRRFLAGQLLGNAIGVVRLKQLALLFGPVNSPLARLTSSALKTVSASKRFRIIA